MRNLKGKVVVITGAGSGMGREMALQLATLGCHLALNDYDADSLEMTASQARSSGVNVSTHPFDVADREALKKWPEEVRANHGHLDVLINNAGVAIGLAKYTEVSEEDIDWVMGINLHAVMYGTKYFLPYLLERPTAAIVNMSSILGLMGVPEQVPYCTTKFAVRGFSEALRAELAETNICVHSVHPGGIKTNIVRSARHYKGDLDTINKVFEDKLAKTTAEAAARRIIKGIQRKEPKILVGLDAEIIDRMTRFVPSNMSHLIQRGFEQVLLGQSMKDLKL